MGKTVAVAIILLSIIFFGFVLISNKNKESKKPLLEKNPQQTYTIQDQAQPVDKQASFDIFTNGTFRVFTASMYHNLSEDVYIQADNPNLVHVKKAGITWNDFFKTLPFSLTKDCLITGSRETFCSTQTKKLKFTLNGENTPNALDLEIKQNDKLVVSYGD